MVQFLFGLPHQFVLITLEHIPQVKKDETESMRRSSPQAAAITSVRSSVSAAKIPIEVNHIETHRTLNLSSLAPSQISVRFGRKTTKTPAY